MTVFPAMRAAAERMGRVIGTLARILSDDSSSSADRASGDDDVDTIFQKGPARARAELGARKILREAYESEVGCPTGEAEERLCSSYDDRSAPCSGGAD